MITAKKNDRQISDRECAIATSRGFSHDFVQILISRGINLEEIDKFINPSLKDLTDPYEIKNLDKAVERLKKAVVNKEKVMIFGDYDCDGVCATSIFMLALRDKLDIQYYIPNRDEGYGLSKESIDSAIGRWKPDLFITVDCGITAIEEVEYLKQKGVEVIITDHHEPKEEIPDCIVVDPKIEKTGFYEFCGAGLVLKIIQAMYGIDEAKKYLDIAALATVADIVPLVSDNRIITKLGIQNMNRNSRRCFRMLADNNVVTTQEISFKLAPKINAMGRVGIAGRAVELFLEDDYFLLTDIVAKMNEQNTVRQKLCEEVVDAALEEIKQIDFNKEKIIILSGENWESGVIGIASARLCEMFHLPVILFQEKEGVLKGSARSIEDVNLYECISEVSDLCTSFGGHAMAAGVILEKKNYAEFKRRMNDIVRSKFHESIFEKNEYTDMEIDLHTDMKPFIAELDYLEPTGLSNPRPSFLLTSSELEFSQISATRHVKSKNKYLEVIGFKKYPYLKDMGKFTAQYKLYLDLNEYGRNITSQGIIAGLNILQMDMTQEEFDIFNLHQMKYYSDGKMLTISEQEAIENSKVEHGILFVFNSVPEHESCKYESIKSLPYHLVNQSYMLPTTSVIIAPGEDFDFKYYKKVIFMKAPLSVGYMKNIPDYVQTYLFEDEVVSPIVLSDKKIKETIYNIQMMSRSARDVVGLKSLYKNLNSSYKISYRDFLIVCNIMIDIGQMEIQKNNVEVRNGEFDWEKSNYYKNLKHE